jgi:hypothetical protein
MTNIVISDWTAILSLIIIVGSYVWSITFKLSGIVHSLKNLEFRLDRLEQTVDAIKVNSDRIPMIVYRLDKTEKEVDQLKNNPSKLP